MKKKLLSYILVSFLISSTSFAQNTWQAWDPFTWDPDTGIGNDVLYDIAFNANNVPFIGEGYMNFNPRTLAWLSSSGNWDTTSAPSSVYNSYRAMTFDHSGNLWCGGGYFVAKYSSGTWTVYLGSDMGIPGPFNISGIETDTAGNVWILVDGIPSTDYLVKYDGSTFTTWNITVQANDPSQYYRNGLFTDLAGNVYLRSPWADSLMVFDGTTFTRFNFWGYTPPAGWKIIATGADNNNGDFYMMIGDTQDSAQLIEYAGGFFYTSMPTVLPPDFFRYELMIDHQGRVWYASNYNLVEFDGTYWNSWSIPASLGGPMINEFKTRPDLRDDIWVLGENTGNTIFKFTTSNPQVILGSVYLDLNANGVRDTLEPGLPDITVAQSPDNFAAVTGSNGNYSLPYSDSLLSYAVSIVTPPYWTVSGTPSYSVNPSSQATAGYDFGLVPISGITDVQVHVSSWRPKPGYGSAHYLLTRNTGTQTVNDTLTYVYDSLFHYIGTEPLADYISGDTVKWYYTLQPGQAKQYFVSLNLDSSAVIGDTLHSFATIGPVASDTVPLDNIVTFVQVAVASFDPNEKTVSPDGAFSPGQELSYTVYFQNTGNAPASKVRIHDQLDTQLDLSTFHINGSSHPMTYTLKDAGELDVTFDNIALPDSTANEPGSHGFVQYSIRPKTGLLNGAQIHNIASIFFDFNLPVLTNTTNNTLVIIGVGEVLRGDNIVVYPNPASQSLHIKQLPVTANRIEITDLSGRVIRAIRPAQKEPVVDVSGLQSGTYLMKIYTDDEVFVKKIVILK